MEEEKKTWQDQACWLEELLKATRSEQLSVLGERERCPGTEAETSDKGTEACLAFLRI